MNTLSILLVEDNETHSHLVQRHLRRARLTSFEIVCAQTLEHAIEAATTKKLDAVLLDLSLPDSVMTETLPTFIQAVPDLPVIVLTSLDDLDFASNLVQQGADDFLAKATIDGQVLLRSIRYAIERRKIRAKLADYAYRLQRSNEELKSFAHTVAHEVRSPLNIVSCCLALVNEDHGDVLGPDSREAMADAKAAIAGMTDLVTDLLEYSRVENATLELTEVDTKQTLAEVTGLLKNEIRDSGAEITADALPCIRGNPIQLRQLLRNLISNAIKYQQPGRPPRIHISAQEMPSHWQFTISDNGLGIPSEHLAKVFAPFARMHESTGIAGTGIGLSYCRRIVVNHDGEIWVESTPGVGSQFHFTLAKAPVDCP